MCLVRHRPGGERSGVDLQLSVELRSNSYCANITTTELLKINPLVGIRPDQGGVGVGEGRGSLGLVRHRPGGERPGVDLQLSVELQIE